MCHHHPLKQVNGLNASQWQDAIVDQICERIFVAMGAGNVQTAFDYFDVDGDGNIEYEEFVNALKALEIGLTDDQVRVRGCARARACVRVSQCCYRHGPRQPS